jgi:hypothetical protein
MRIKRLPLYFCNVTCRWHFTYKVGIEVGLRIEKLYNQQSQLIIGVFKSVRNQKKGERIKVSGYMAL